VRVEPKSNGIPDLKHNHYDYAMSSMLMAWQTQLTFSFEFRHATRPNVQLVAQ